MELVLAEAEAAVESGVWAQGEVGARVQEQDFLRYPKQASLQALRSLALAGGPNRVPLF